MRQTTLKTFACRLIAVGLIAAAVSAALDEDASLSAVRKFQQIAEGALPSGTPVEFTETELNSFLEHHGKPLIPTAIEDPDLKLRAGGAAFRATVDLDKAAATSDQLPALLRLLFRGTREIAVEFDYAVQNSKATLAILSLSIDETEVPQTVVEWFVEAYAPPELRPFLSPDGTKVQMGVSDLKIERGRVVTIVE